MTIEISFHDAAMLHAEAHHAHANGCVNGHIKPDLKKPNHNGWNVVDIRSDKEEHSILGDIRQGLQVPPGQEKTLPTMLLYDEEGLKLFERITYLEEYYLTNTEIQILETYADRIAQRIPDGAMVIELGSGNLRKVNILLAALEKQRKNVEYFALDLSIKELERTLSQLPNDAYQHVKCFGLWGTYDDGLEWIQRPPVVSRPKTIVWLGSSIGNFTRESAIGFVRSFADALQETDTMLIGIDACKDPEKVYHAYNDREGLTHRFIMNGLLNANRLLGSEQFKLDEWQVIGEFDVAAGRHHAFVSPLKDVAIEKVAIPKGEKIRIEESYKWSDDEAKTLWRKTGMVEGAFWSNTTGDYGLHMMSKSNLSFPTQVGRYAAAPAPSLAEWSSAWAAWDAVTRRMIPDEELLQKPIKLRNACIFYLGHIPTFLDIHLARATGESSVGPPGFWNIFERGVDPDVENPEVCHAHSDVPDTWPAIEEIIGFQDHLRAKVRSLYEDGRVQSNPVVARAMWIGFEHELMHLETLLYMLIQSEKMAPPPNQVAPDFESSGKAAGLKVVENEWFTIPERTLSVGLDDPDATSGSIRFFGWDNEHPRRTVHVGSFVAKARAITNHEYAQYLLKTDNDQFPASWVYKSSQNTQKRSTNGHANGHTHDQTKSYANGHANGSATEAMNGNNSISKSYLHDKAVRTVYGLVPLAYALDWPVFASYNEIDGCAKWMGGRIPTADEVRSIYEYVEALKTNNLENSISTTIPAVNGHLVNDGVEETPPPHHSIPATSGIATVPNPQELFVNLDNSNVGLKHWHPIPVAPFGNRLAGRGELGGVWEWTSSVLEAHKGFEPMSLYPGYTADFFDTKHNIVLGGSWATHPRIAGRKSFVNWYQRNYPYAWAGARLVKDLQ